MRHGYYGRHLRRDTNASKNLYRSLLEAVVLHGKIETTLTKAKAVQGDLEKLMLLSKTDNQNNRKNVARILGNNQFLERLFLQIGPSFSDVNSGFTRILKLGPRWSDTAEMAILELTRRPVVTESQITKNVSNTAEEAKDEKVKTKSVKTKAVKTKSAGKLKTKKS